jgi:hypothetical protein
LGALWPTLLHFAPANSLACRAPPWPHRRLGNSLNGPPNQRHSVQIDWLPIVTMDSKVEALVASPAKHHQGAAVSCHLHDSQPHQVSNLRGHTAAEHARRQVPA